MLYRWIVRPLLYSLQAERAHDLVMSATRLVHASKLLCALTRALYGSPPACLRVRAMGLDFPSPLGLAAGLDKDATAYRAFGALGFGFVEVGTLTFQTQPGNPKPRLFRLPGDRALINRMGFNNCGAADAARRIAADGKRELVLGINIGKTKVVEDSAALEDYCMSARELAPLADYLVVNVSSPNTPGLRDLQAVSRLRPLLVAVRAAIDASVPHKHVPLLVKIAPDLSDEDLDAIADLALELGLDGLIATNTTSGRAGLQTPSLEVEALGAGGLSGAPLKARSLAILRRLRERVGTRLTLVSAGGIESEQDVWQRLEAGAQLVQLYSALVFEGPGLPMRIARGLAARLGQGSLAESARLH